MRERLARIALAGLLCMISTSLPSVEIEDPDGRGLAGYVARLQGRFPSQPFDTLAVVKVAHQRLYLITDKHVQKSYPVSTSRYGTGSAINSLRTPLGMHRVRRRIGDGEPLGSVFKARVPTGELYHAVLGEEPDPADLVTTRILWLDGMEAGLNKGEGVDSFSRYIYIHGTHAEDKIGNPASIGCVRMKNADVIELYDALPEGAPVLILK